MVSRFFMAWGLLLLFAVASPAGEAEKELERLQGDWVAVYEEINGVPCKEGEFPRIEMTIKGDKWISKVGLKSTFTLTLTPTADPKQIDMKCSEGAFAGLYLGIYKLDGDTFTICDSSGEKTRPTGFATKGSFDLKLHVFKRVKS
jgi:uncharacterized protein (TIGR03067 family)